MRPAAYGSRWTRTRWRPGAEELVGAGVVAVAVVFLHAYANPGHKAAAVRVIGERFPHLHVTASHEVAPEIREYERASTTVANAYIKPLAHRYLATLLRSSSERTTTTSHSQALMW